MWSGRKKSIEEKKTLYFNNNQITNIFSNNGNVGIGVQIPATKLDVSGTINTSSQYTINYVPIAPPIGSIIAYTSLAISPPGWLLCNGTAVSRVTYASLFAVIGTTFGTGDNSITFNLPNYQGAFLRGTGTNANGIYSGPSINTSQEHATQTHTHAANSVVTDPGHTHDFTDNYFAENMGGGSNNHFGTSADTDNDNTLRTVSNTTNTNTTGISVATTIANSTTSVNENETRPYNFGVFWIIKY